MTEEKVLAIHELRYYHSDSIGFVFTGQTPSSDEAIQRLIDNLRSWKVTKEDPLFYTRVGDNAVAFVFDSYSGFRMTQFYQASKQFTRLGFFEIDTLCSWLRERESNNQADS